MVKFTKLPHFSEFAMQEEFFKRERLHLRTCCKGVIRNDCGNCLLLGTDSHDVQDPGPKKATAPQEPNAIESTHSS